MTNAATVHRAESLSVEDTAAVMALVEQAAAVDGVSALNEAASLRLRHHSPGTVHFLTRDAEEVIGYGQVQIGEPAPRPAQGALVVHPHRRRRGLGTALLGAMISHSPYGLEIWATRHTKAARAFAAHGGLVPVRQLLIMTRPLTEPVPVAEVPAGVEIRSFRPGQDENAWLGVNARAFADHPEQGGITRADLDERMSEPWFDPEGFLVAEQAQGTKLLGFHWTKQHRDRLGEVYVLGVDPEAGVRGLGRALLAAGLEHLRAAGNSRVQLYVDAENTRAVDLYERAGFSIASSDVMYAGPSAGVEPLATMHMSSDPA